MIGSGGNVKLSSRRRGLAAVIGLGLAGTSGHAFASVPALTDAPKPATLTSCQVWAAKQDEDAIYMSGTKENGESSHDLAVTRLTATCLGEKPPEIVGFYSSAGAADAFCAKHSDAQICRSRGKRATAEPADADKPTWHGDAKMIEYGVEGTDDRSLRVGCEKGQLFALGPWDGGAGGRKRITFEAAGAKETLPITVFEGGDGDNYEAKMTANSPVIVGLLREENVIVRGKTALRVPGAGSAKFLRALLAVCRR